MIKQKQAIALAVCLASTLVACGQKAAEPSADTATTARGAAELAPRSVDELIAQMSVDEKVMLVHGQGFSMPGGKVEAFERVPGAAGYTYPVESAGLPALVMADGPAGLRITAEREGEDKRYYATAFPVAANLSASWDDQLLYRVGQAMGEEVLEYGIDLLLGPGMTIQRDPLGGRNFEYYSEDPHLSGHLAAAMVNGIESQGVGATIKHFVANNEEFNRLWLDTIVGERALREIYLRGFEIAVEESNPWAIMSSYNKVNGVYTSQSRDLLTTILRDEWHYDGLVMTDWFAGDDAVAQIKAGNNLIMPGVPETTQALKAGLANGSLTEQDLDDNVKYILDVALRAPSVKGYKFSNEPDLKGHAVVARQAAAEGIVLLKNAGGTLPLSAASSKVAVFGKSSYEFISGGTGSGDVNEAYTVSLLDGLDNAGFSIDSALKQQYEAYIPAEKAKLPPKAHFLMPDTPIPELVPAAGELKRLAQETDIALITLGRRPGEMADVKIDGGFNLTAGEQELIGTTAEVYHAAGKKVVVILNVGNAIETASWRDQVDAIVVPWQGGQEAGNALVDVLSGKVNPSGKLASTFPVHYQDVSTAANFPGRTVSDEPISVLDGLLTGYASEVEYQEGIYVGYRYFDTFDVKPSYPFGFGLSYTEFNYGPVRLGSATFDGEMQVEVDVTNSGKVAGKEVVQLYVSAPAGSLDKPRKELKGYAKTALLRPGKTETLKFSLNTRDLASFDATSHAWVAEAGSYQVIAAASSADGRSQASFTLPGRTVVASVNPVLQPQRALEEIHP